MRNKKKKLNLKNDSCVIEDGTLVWINPLLKEFTIPEGVEVVNICNYIFKNEEDIKWVKKFDVDFFEEDPENKMLLEKITFPDSLEIIRECGLFGCKYLKEVVFPSGLKCVEDSAFENCENIEKIVINSAETELYNCVFTNCNKVKEVTMPSGWRYCSEYWFGNGASIEKINLIGEIHKYDQRKFEKYLRENGYEAGYYSLSAPNLKEINIIKKDDDMLLREVTSDKFYFDLLQLVYAAFEIYAISKKMIDFSKITVNFSTEDNSDEVAKLLNGIVSISGSIDIFIQFMRTVCEKIEKLSLSDKKQKLCEIYDNLSKKQEVNKALFTLLNRNNIFKYNSRKDEFLLFDVKGFYDEKETAVLDLALSNKSTSEVLKEFNDKISSRNVQKGTTRVKK